MRDELSIRQTAMRLRLAGESVKSICRTLKRSKPWFHKWWQRYLESGPEGLYDLTRGNRQVVNRTPPHIERAVISIRRRLAAHATPQTRYSRIGATQIRAELEVLGYSPLPCLRTIDRIIARAGLSCPPLRLAPRIGRNAYPGPQARDSNQLHQVDVVGPRYLKGNSTRYYFLICKDVFDQSIYMEFVDSRRMDGVIDFLVRTWQQLGLPEQVQFDNAREFCGFGHAARFLSRVIRLCLRLEIEPVFIPKAKPQHNGSVENFNGWFQPLLLNRPFRRPCDVRCELGQLRTTVNEQHVHAKLGGRTAAQYRRGKRLRKLPANFTIDEKKLPIAAGKVTFIRLVSIHGTISILGQSFKVGKRLKFHYVKVTIYTKYQNLKVYHKGKLIKEFPYPLSNK
ncbi:MAG: DDE-type integrase/transposase/recombinase [Anaerolineaceae bacterium]|nr:DDE-type integrase/transposase/recombinase [Anaerolineaceae bacterium]